MNVLNTHYWVVGDTRKDREASYPLVDDRPTFRVDCHRGIAGPYSGTSQLIRYLVPEVMKRSPELLQRFSVALRIVAPELKEVVSGPETLTTLANSKERTRFFSHNRTPRIAHGVIDFLKEVTAPQHLGAIAVVFENVHEADVLDQECLRLLVKRAKPEQLLLVLSAQEAGLQEELAEALQHAAVRVSATATGLSLAEAERMFFSLSVDERMRFGRQFVLTDCTSDDVLERLAYEAMSKELRALWHDERASQLEREEIKFRECGALLLHRERGTDAQETGLAAIMKALDYCSRIGFYEWSLELANRGFALRGEHATQNQLYYNLSNMKIQALLALGRIKEAEDVCIATQMKVSFHKMHMMLAYSLAMIFTRYRTERDHQLAKAWSQVAIAFASQLEDRKERAFRTVFYQNGLALVELHMGNSEQALKLVMEGYDYLDREMDQDEQLLHRSVLLYNRGQILSRQKRYAEALEVYEQVVAIDPNYPEYHFDIGNIHNMLGNYEAALASYQRAIEVSIPFPEVHHNRGLLYKKLGRVEEALADFSYLIELDADDVEALTHRASLLFENGQLELARRDVTHALTVQSQHAELLGLLGMIEMEGGRLQAALEAFTSSLATNVANVETWTNRAVVRFELGDIAGAVADLTEALALGENETVLYNRAWAYQAAEQWDLAIADYTEALQLPDADAADIFYQRGCCYLQAGRQEQGMADWKQHLVLAGQESAYQAEIAVQAPALVS